MSLVIKLLVLDKIFNLLTSATKITTILAKLIKIMANLNLNEYDVIKEAIIMIVSITTPPVIIRSGEVPVLLRNIPIVKFTIRILVKSEIARLLIQRLKNLECVIRFS